MAERYQTELDMKHLYAEQRTVEKLTSIQEKAKIHNQKVSQNILTKAVENEEELNSMKARIENKMARINALQNDEKLEKVKAYNEKHQQKVEDFLTAQQKKLKELKTKKSNIESRLNKAAERRDEVITQVKLTAAQSALLKNQLKK